MANFELPKPASTPTEVLTFCLNTSGLYDAKVALWIDDILKVFPIMPWYFNSYSRGNDGLALAFAISSFV